MFSDKSALLNSAVISVAALALAACGQPATNVEAPGDASIEAVESVSEDERLSAFFEEVFEREVALSPLFEADLGRKTENYGLWDDASDAAAEAENQRREDDLARLADEFDYTALSVETQVSYDIFAYQTEQAIRNFKFRNNRYVAHHTDSYALYLPVVMQNLHAGKSVV